MSDLILDDWFNIFDQLPLNAQFNIIRTCKTLCKLGTKLPRINMTLANQYEDHEYFITTFEDIELSIDVKCLILHSNFSSSLYQIQGVITNKLSFDELRKVIDVPYFIEAICVNGNVIMNLNSPIKHVWCNSIRNNKAICHAHTVNVNEYAMIKTDFNFPISFRGVLIVREKFNIESYVTEELYKLDIPYDDRLNEWLIYLRVDTLVVRHCQNIHVYNVGPHIRHLVLVGHNIHVHARVHTKCKVHFAHTHDAYDNHLLLKSSKALTFI